MTISTQNVANKSPTQECNTEHLDPVALDALADIVDRLRRCNVVGYLAPQDEWFEALDFPAPYVTVIPSHTLAIKKTKSSVPLLHNPAQTVDDNKTAKRFSAALDTLRLASTALSAIQERISQQMETGESRLASLRIRGGLSSLPDDILSLVLEYASEGKNSTLGVALGLSHVCQRFRQLALRIPALWRHIGNHSNIRLVSILCDRITKPIAEITFDDAVDAFSTADFATFSRILVARCEAWYEMIHRLSHSDRDVWAVIARETHQLRTPFLSRLSIEGSEWLLQEEPLEDTLHYYSTWSMPRLNSFFVEDFVPIPLITAISLTEFSLRLAFRDISPMRAGDSLSSLILFLGSCPALKIVMMIIDSFPEFTGFSTTNFANLPTVETLKLSFSNSRGSVLRTFFQNARFPNVSTMGLTLFAWAGRGGLYAVFRDTQDFENLARLTLYASGAYRDQSVQIPFQSLSKLQHLTLTMTKGIYGDIPPDGPCLPVLKTLTLKGFDDSNRDWVKSLLARLKDQGSTPEVRKVGLWE